MKDINVVLSWSELSVAADVGKYRHIRSLQKNLKDKHGFNGDDGWTIHVEGAAGEMAFAKAMNVYWSMACDVFKAPDIGGNVQIRTRSKDDYELIVRPGDSDTDAFVLMTGKAPHFCIKGWVTGKEAKQKEWSKAYANRPAAFFVPQSALHDLSTLVIQSEVGDIYNSVTDKNAIVKDDTPRFNL